MADHIVRPSSADDSGPARDRTTTELSPEALQQLLRENAQPSLDDIDAAVEAAVREREQPLASGSLDHAPKWAHTFRREVREDEVSTIAMPRIDRRFARSSIDPDEHAATRRIPLELGRVESSAPMASAGNSDAVEVCDPEILIEVSAEVGVIDGAHDSVAILHSPPLRKPSTSPALPGEAALPHGSAGSSPPPHTMTQPIRVTSENEPILLEPSMVIARQRPPHSMTTMKVESLRRLPVVSMPVLTPPPGLPLQRPTSARGDAPQPFAPRQLPDPPFTRSRVTREPRILAPLTRKLPRYVVHRLTAPRIALVLAIVLAACYWYAR